MVAGLAKYGGVTASATSMTTEGYVPQQAIRSALDKVGPGSHPQDLGHMSAEQRAQWWSRLSPAEREAVLQEFPEYIGGGQGLPPSVRDVANRQNLDRDIAQSQAVLNTPFLGLHTARDQNPGSSERLRAETTLRNALAVRAGIEKAEASARGKPPVLLYGYDAHAFGGDGKAIVGIGDLDTARHVSWNVPGLTTDITKTSGNVQNAANLFNSAGGTRAGVASVAWIGYDAPSGLDSGSVAAPAAAREGGALLADDIEGFVAARDQLGLGQGVGAEEKLDVHVIGHSYGSVTTGWAGDDGRLAGDVDTVTLIGSPGAGGAATADEFGIGAENVYVGSASNDPVTFLGGTAGWYPGLGGLGTDPATTDFGAERFRAEGGTTAIGIGPHASYYERGTESLENLTEIVTGDGDDISHENRRSNWDVYSIGGDPARARDDDE